MQPQPLNSDRNEVRTEVPIHLDAATLVCHQATAITKSAQKLPLVEKLMTDAT